jgi:hypothetical protein
VSVIGDLCERAQLKLLAEWAQEGEAIPVERLQALVNGKASAMNVERHGPTWLADLCDAAERGGVGWLERRDDGAVVFVPDDDAPDGDTAWRRIVASWADADDRG